MNEMDATFRFLGPDEGSVLSGPIESAYAQSYDVRWVYEPVEVGARIAARTHDWARGRDLGAMYSEATAVPTAACCGFGRCAGSESRPTTFVASDHGRELLECVLADLPQAA
jgi:hypothetical protein